MAVPPPLMMPLSPLVRALPDLSRPPPAITTSVLGTAPTAAAAAVAVPAGTSCLAERPHQLETSGTFSLDGGREGDTATRRLSEQERQTYILQLKAAALLGGKGMKRSLEVEGSNKTIKRNRSHDMALRLLISSKAAGSVIGKGGANINRLREQNSATISIPDSMGPERVLSVSADRPTTLKVVQELMPSLGEVAGKEQDTAEGEIRVLVHTSQAGSIIGRSGFKIKELREETAAQIRVYTEPCPQSSDRVALISGPCAALLQCLERILALLDENPPKGVVSPYDPNNYDELFAGEYGGFADGRGRLGSAAAGRGVVTSMAAAVRGFAPSAGLVTQRRGFGRGVSPAGVGGLGYCLPGQLPSSLPTAGVDFSAAGVPGLQTSGEQHTQQFSIPKGAAGAIIGKGGARIRKIRQDSQAQITIDDSKTGQTERIVTITGTPDQVQMAHFLLQNSVRENSNGIY